MKKILVFIILTVFLMSSVFAVKYTFKAVAIDSNKYTFKAVDSGESNDTPTNADTANQTQAKNVASKKIQVQDIIKARNKLRVKSQGEECPEDCTCTGSVTKCELENKREMTIMAGKSGNTIVQVKEANMTTNVTLYKSEGKVYGIFKGNMTRVVKMLPDQVQEKIRERIARELEVEKIELDEDGNYQYQARKRARLFGFIPVKVQVKAQVNSETGELVRIKNSWWAFLASDEGEPIVGASCGTVSPDGRDECCINKGYDLWNEETLECEFYGE